MFLCPTLQPVVIFIKTLFDSLTVLGRRDPEIVVSTIISVPPRWRPALH